ncbi:MAG: hypothetical protein NTY96_05010 [Bacteroidetes bacterium]|nr:hypothetical protein [Bacteroidota bacterium]
MKHKGNNAMKRVAFIAVIISLLMSACKTQQQAVSVNNDDVYSTPARQKSKPATSPNFNQDLTSALAGDQTAVTHDSLTKAATLDYSDVSYADRLQKFQHPQSNKSYFDNTTSDTTVVYSNNPNVSFNLGFGGGFYDPSFSMGFGWGYPSYGWGYPSYGWGYGWGYPYYWDYPYWWYYNSYPYCYCCYYPYGEGNGYYNSYYGPRQSVVTNTAYLRNSRSDVTNTTPSTRNERGVPVTANDRSAPPASVRTSGQPAPATRTVGPVYTRTGTQPAPGVRSIDPVTTQRKPPASQERYHYARPANERQGTYSRNTGNNNAYRETKQQPAPRYTQPSATPVQRQGQVQNYTPGNYRQARSSQEYINPRIQAQNSAGRPATTSGPRGGSSVEQRGYSSPGNSAGSRSTTPGSGTRQYSSPRNYSPGNSSPSRGYSPNYSSPSRSAPSYSSPSGGSRSGGGGGGYSGGGGGGRSGGGGGGGSPRK